MRIINWGTDSQESTMKIDDSRELVMKIDDSRELTKITIGKLMILENHHFQDSLYRDF